MDRVQQQQALFGRRNFYEAQQPICLVLEKQIAGRPVPTHRRLMSLSPANRVGVGSGVGGD